MALHALSLLIPPFAEVLSKSIAGTLLLTQLVTCGDPEGNRKYA